MGDSRCFWQSGTLSGQSQEWMTSLYKREKGHCWIVEVPFQHCQYLVQEVACGKTPYCHWQFSLPIGC